jgi:transposase
LSLLVTGANRHDSVALDALLKVQVIKPTDEQALQNLCLDAAYVGKEEVVKANGFIPHIRPRGEEKKLIERDPTFKARRWVVELAHSWFNRFRKLVPRYEKTDLSYNALNALAAAMIVLNKVMVIYR